MNKLTIEKPYWLILLIFALINGWLFFDTLTVTLLTGQFIAFLTFLLIYLFISAAPTLVVTKLSYRKFGVIVVVIIALLLLILGLD